MYSLGLQLHDEQVYGPALVHNEYLVIFTAAAVVIVVVVVVVVVVFGSGWVSHLRCAFVLYFRMSAPGFLVFV